MIWIRYWCIIGQRFWLTGVIVIRLTVVIGQLSVFVPDCGRRFNPVRAIHGRTFGWLVLPLVRWPKGSRFGSGLAGFGAMFRIDRAEQGFAARFLAYFAVFPCVGALDDEADRVLAQAFDDGRLPEMRSFRRDAHQADSSCLLHGRGYCFSTADTKPEAYQPQNTSC